MKMTTQKEIKAVMRTDSQGFFCLDLLTQKSRYFSATHFTTQSTHQSGKKETKDFYDACMKLIKLEEERIRSKVCVGVLLFI